MAQSNHIDWDRYDAAILDMDGVITRSASVHAAAWKRMFDEFLRRRASRGEAAFEPFEIDTDYALYVDGKPRYDGARAFLASRGIELPYGDPDDEPGAETVCGLGNLKNRYFREHLEEHGVEAYGSTMELVRALRQRNKKLAVISASRNARRVLEAAGALDLFDVVIDGVEAERANLAGKPAPDIFIAAAERLGVERGRAVVIEDAVAGVRAGRAGGFGLVVGVDRTGNPGRLAEQGADLVVGDLEELDALRLVYDRFRPESEKLREALCTLGNGYFATRGAAPEAAAGDVHYSGTYLAGVYNRLTSDVGDRTVENESMVNVPNWLPLTFRIEDGEWFDLQAVRVLAYRQELDLARGTLSRTVRFEDGKQRRTRLVQRRFVHMSCPHLAGLETVIEPENWSGRLQVRSALDGRVENTLVERYHALNNRHLEALEAGVTDDDLLWLAVRTVQSAVRIGEAARTRLYAGGELLDAAPRTIRQHGYVGREYTLEAHAGTSIRVEKIAAVYHSRDAGISDVSLDALETLRHAGTFAELLERHAVTWKHLWNRWHIEVGASEARVQQVLNLHIFHLLQTVSPNTVGLDAGVPPRGLHGEAYRGLIMWDELFIFPLLNLRMPDITRSLLMYRYRRLGRACRAAREAGYAGAMFPWQSGSNGREEAQTLHLNPASGRWIPDNSQLQRHINIAVAYNIWQYYEVTEDKEFLAFYGAEMLVRIARFWAAKAEYNASRGRYDIRGVMGPDEFHDGYPEAGAPGLDNNAYTNIMAAWLMGRTLAALDVLPPWRRAAMQESLGVDDAEIKHWDELQRKLYVPFLDGGVIAQFEGYDALREFDWETYRERYGDIHRLDRILESEGDTPNRYKLSKQADVLMTFFLLSADELSGVFERLGYPFDRDTIPGNIEYYLQRTAHGSTLSRVVHAWVLARSQREESWHLFRDALESDVADIQGGTTPEGIHLGAMAGTVDLILRCYAGIESRGDVLRFNPSMPAELASLKFQIRYRRCSIDVEIGGGRIRLCALPDGETLIDVAVQGRRFRLKPCETKEMELDGEGRNRRCGLRPQPVSLQTPFPCVDG